MPIPAIWVLVALASVLVAIAAGRLVAAWWKYGGDMVVSCPENQRPAGVHVDAVHAALTGAAAHPALRLNECSRWPERAGCGQQCLSQIEGSPEDCLVRVILDRWYAGKSCACCGHVIGPIQWSGVKPGLRTADKAFVDWSQVPPERLQDTLLTASPVCVACQLANTLVREYPSIALDRSRPGIQ